MENLFELSVEDRRRRLLLALGRANLQKICGWYALDVSDRRRPEAYVDAIVKANVPMFQSLGVLSRDELKDLCRQLEIPDIGTEKAVLAKRISRSIATRSLRRSESIDTDETGSEERDENIDDKEQARQDYFSLSFQERRQLLLLLVGRANLKNLCEFHSIEVSDRRRVDAYVEAIVQANIPMSQVLSLLSRNELKYICQGIGIDHIGTEKALLAKRISQTIDLKIIPQSKKSDSTEQEDLGPKKSEAPKHSENSRAKNADAKQRHVHDKHSVANQRRTKVFISYSRKDREWLDRLHVHLRPLHRQGIIDLWDDTKISAGMAWQEEIQCAIETAKVAILLVSAHFLDSDFIYNNELPPLLDAAKNDGLTILPVIISPCVLSNTPIRRYQAINSPDETLMDLEDAKREWVFVKLVNRIDELLRK